MARIAPTTVMQMVGDDQIVFVDDRTGAEVAVPMTAVPTMIEMAIYFAATAEHLHIDPIPNPLNVAWWVGAREAAIRVRD